MRAAECSDLHEQRSNLPFVQDWPKSDFPDRNYARLKVARLEDRALLGSNPSAEWVNVTVHAFGQPRKKKASCGALLQLVESAPRSLSFCDFDSKS